MGKKRLRTEGFVSDSRGVLWRRRGDPPLPHEITDGVYLGGSPQTPESQSPPLSINNYVEQFEIADDINLQDRPLTPQSRSPSPPLLITNDGESEEEGDTSTPRRDSVTSSDNDGKREVESVDIEELRPPQNRQDSSPQKVVDQTCDEEDHPKVDNQELQPSIPSSQYKREISCSVAQFGKEVVVLESDEDGSMSLRVDREQIHLKAIIPRFYDTWNGVTDQSFDLTLSLTTLSSLNVTSNGGTTHLHFQLKPKGGLKLKNSTYLALGMNFNEAEFTLVPKDPLPMKLVSKWTRILKRKIRFVDSGKTMPKTEVTIGYTVDSVHLGKYCFTGRASIGLYNGTIAVHMRKSTSQRDLPFRVLFPKDSSIKYYLATHERNGEIHPLLFISLKSKTLIPIFENKLKIRELENNFNPKSSSKEIKYLALLLNATPNLEKQLTDIQTALGSSCSTPKADKLNQMLYYIRQNLKRVAVAVDDLSDEAPTNIITPKRSLEDSDVSISHSTPPTRKAIKLETTEDVKTRFEKSHGLKYATYKKPTGNKIALGKPEDDKPVDEELELKSVTYEEFPLIKHDFEKPQKIKSLEIVESLQAEPQPVVEEIPLVKPDTDPIPLKVKRDKVNLEKFKRLEKNQVKVKSPPEIRFECFSVKAGDFLVCGIHVVNSPGLIEAIFSPRGLLLKTNAPKFMNPITKKIGQRDSFEIPMNSILEVLVHPIVFNNLIFLGLSKEEGDRLRNKFQLDGSTFKFNPEEDIVYGNAKLKYFQIYPRLKSGVDKVLAEFRALFGDRVKLMDKREAEYFNGNSLINPLNPRLKFHCSAIHFGTLKYTNESFFRFEMDKSNRCIFGMSVLDSTEQNVVSFEVGYDATFELGHWRTEDGSPHLLLSIIARSSKFALDLGRDLKVADLAHHYYPKSESEEKRNLILVVKIDEDVTRMMARIKGVLRNRCIDISGDERGVGKRMSKLREVVERNLDSN